jgi:hypothetical protein
MKPEKQPQAAEVAKRLNELKALRYDELLTMPASTSVEIDVSGVPIAVATWIDKPDAGWMVSAEFHLRQTEHPNALPAS